MNRIVLVGHSLGGGLATIVATSFPGIHICNDRSFSTLSLVAQHVLLDASILSSPHWFHRTLTHAAAALLKYGVLWELDTARYWLKCRGGSKWIATAVNDKSDTPRPPLVNPRHPPSPSPNSIITPPTQLATALEGMSLSRVRRGDTLIMGLGRDGHNRPWSAPERRQHFAFIDKAIAKQY